MARLRMRTIANQGFPSKVMYIDPQAKKVDLGSTATSHQLANDERNALDLYKHDHLEESRQENL